jgi:hypothetical protein
MRHDVGSSCDIIGADVSQPSAPCFDGRATARGGRLPAVSAASACARRMHGASLSPLLRVRTRQASHHATARTLCQVRRARRVPLLPVCTP